ncbi:GHMP family kinase ATP-binding protein [Desulfobacula toluolica]|uniref:GHMP kinase n=1 Tax=Desulfobacula toluolica (strain DSM 7467 / Tol2) TaxID=651182 RepID=K0N8X6_DESTT|nr:galactokinase [Desulfobacula toluolica]CCK80384.1 GHMP kinase [Desulfobacula toluolica Tol2]
MNFKKILEHQKIHASVPCRVDLGGTLDISTFYLPMIHRLPSTFNIALDLRTAVCLSPWQKGYVKVSSRGFEAAVFKKDEAPFNHPMGLMFAVAKYFDAHGVHIHIESASPPKSALGGSSAAAVAIIAAFFKALANPIDPKQIAWLAHYTEASVAGVPCGMQDQLAAAFGGVNQWIWKMGKGSPEFEQNPVLETNQDIEQFNLNILIAYCGIPHVSKDINQQWVKSFVRGETRLIFEKIADLTKNFSKAVKNKNFKAAAEFMNQETKLRLEMTPDVLDNTGKKLFEKAVNCDCGARFTGAGGGGCLWAVGEAWDIKNLRSVWQKILEPVEAAKILDTKIETKGIIIHKP